MSVNGLCIAPLALLTGLLPLVCVHLCYLLAASAGHVDWCVPYWDSCTSISATGREVPEKLLFKLLMLPSALLALVFWWMVRQWLRQIQGRDSAAVQLLGSVAALFLLLYVVALGESNDYRWARQSGIILFFSLSYLAQLCFLYQAGRRPLTGLHLSVWRWQLRAAVLLLAIGVGSVLLDLGWERYDEVEDAIEWVLMLFVAAQFCSHYPLWRSSDLHLTIHAGKTGNAG